MTSVTILPEDYAGLKKEYLIIRKELDSVTQELYVTKRQLKVVEVLQLEYQGEIEMLQSEENSQRLKQEEKIAHLEENMSHIKSKYIKQIQALDCELTSKEVEIEKLKTELEHLKKDNVDPTCTDEVYKLLEEVTSLRQEKEDLLEHEEELKLSLEILEKNNLTIEEALTECKEELLHIKESLSCKREELMEANDLVQKLNDELFCLKSELESYQNKPLNTESKGNSLFAEVDDRRVYLQKTINNMKSEYMSIKQERAKHLNTISHLKKENKSLCEQLKKDMEEKEEDQYTVIKAYKDQIQILENLLEKYKQDLAAKPLVMSSGNFKEFEFYQIMLNNKLKEIEELREELKSKGLNRVLLATALKEADKETRKWRLEATLKRYQLELQPGDSVSEEALMKKAEEEVSGPRKELKQTKNWPHLACKNEEETGFYICNRRPSVQKESLVEHSEEVREVITDSRHSIDGEKRGHSVEDLEEKAQYEGARKYDENQAKTTEIECNVDENVHIKEEAASLDENISKRVTFAKTTVSPKATDRTALRARCKRVVLPKPVYFPSE